jgi:putative ABC transport system permease protein
VIEMRRFLLRLLTFLRSHRAEAELAREIDAHLQLLEDSFVAEGLSAEEARDAARRRFGGDVEQTKLRQRDARSFRLLDESWIDVKLGIRMARRYPGLSIIAVFALTVAIGAGAAYHEFANDLLPPTLPGVERGHVVGIQIWDLSTSEREPRALSDFQRWRGQLHSIEHLGAGRPLTRNLITDDGRVEPVRGAEVSASAFALFPTQPLLGRPLVTDDERPNAAAVAVIGERLWRSRFGGDPAIVGRTIRLGSATHVVVGVMPGSFGFPVNHVLWVPFRNADAERLARGQGPSISLFGRLAPGVRLEQAQAELEALDVTERVDPSSPRKLRPEVRFYVDALWAGDGAEGRIQQFVLNAANLLFIGLLCVCSANVATLVFGRTVTRESEITVRTALGAGRLRIVGQLFAEALVLSTIAAVVGLVGASYAFRWGRAVFATAAGDGAPLPFWWDDRLSGETMLYAALLAVAAAALVGVVPALKATGVDMQARLKHATTGAASIAFGGMWTVVIVAQVALTVISLLCMVTRLGVLDQRVCRRRRAVCARAVSVGAARARSRGG